MINSSVTALCALCSQLMLEEMVRENSNELLTHNETISAEEWLKIALIVADDFEVDEIRHRVALIRRQIGFGITHHRLSTEYRTLRQTIEFGLREQSIYRYPKDKIKIMASWQDDWSASIKSFPSSCCDIHAAIDLWALGHYTASVFHLMRVLECGLRVLAKELGKNFDIQNWQNILEEIENEIRKQSKTMPRGAGKSDQLRFFSTAAKDFYFFKDGWRNFVSHNRATYDQYQAKIVLDHVQSFMNELASKLSE